MPIQYTDKPKQPGETLFYKMTFTPGKSLADGDSLAGSPTTIIQKVSDGSDVSATMIEASIRSGNAITVGMKAGTSGESYKITFRCGTTNGETVEEDLVVAVQEL